MSSSSFPIEADTILVADASVVINLNATGRALEIIRALPGSVVVTGNAFAELADGARKGHDDGRQLQALIDGGAVRLVTLGDVGNRVYASLVEGTALRTLDDGEAATIGYAHETGGVAMIDEKKARTICAADFPGLRLASTIDILTHDMVRAALGPQSQIEAIVNALRFARMRVPPERVESVVKMIGADTAAGCNSLPKGLGLDGVRGRRT